MINRWGRFAFIHFIFLLAFSSQEIFAYRCLTTLERVGKGSFGEVWRVFDDDGYESVIKILDGNLSEEARRRIYAAYRQIALLRANLRVDSSCLINCHAPYEVLLRYLNERGDEEFLSRVVLEMEAADGTAASVKDWNFRDLSRMVEDISRALFQLQNLDLVHHDPNPRNILYFIKDRRLQFKLGDLDYVGWIGTAPALGAWEFHLAPIEYESFLLEVPLQGFQEFPSIVDDFYQMAGSIFFMMFGKYPIDIAAALPDESISQKRRRLFSDHEARRQWDQDLQNFLSTYRQRYEPVSSDDALYFEKVVQFLQSALLIDRNTRQAALAVSTGQ